MMSATPGRLLINEYSTTGIWRGWMVSRRECGTTMSGKSRVVSWCRYMRKVSTELNHIPFFDCQ